MCVREKSCSLSDRLLSRFKRNSNYEILQVGFFTKLVNEITHLAKTSKSWQFQGSISFCLLVPGYWLLPYLIHYSSSSKLLYAFFPTQTVYFSLHQCPTIFPSLQQNICLNLLKHLFEISAFHMFSHNMSFELLSPCENLWAIDTLVWCPCIL